MKKFTIYYKDHLGRNNQVQSYGKDQDDVKEKFYTLYSECTITSIETNN